MFLFFVLSKPVYNYQKGIITLRGIRRYYARMWYISVYGPIFMVL